MIKILNKFWLDFKSIPKRFNLIFLLTVLSFTMYIVYYQYPTSLDLLEAVVLHINWFIILFLFVSSLFVISIKGSDFSKALNSTDSIKSYYYGGQLFIALFASNTFFMAIFVKISWLHLSIKSIRLSWSNGNVLGVIVFMLITFITLPSSILLNKIGNRFLDSWIFDDLTIPERDHFKNVKFSDTKLSSNAITYLKK